MQQTKTSLVVGGLVLFSSGVLFGGYVVWAQQTRYSEARAAPSPSLSPSDDNPFGGESAALTPGVDLSVPLGTKSFQVFVPDNPYETPATPADMHVTDITTKRATVFTPQDLVITTDPPEDPASQTRLMTTKSAVVIAPQDIAPSTDPPGDSTSQMRLMTTKFSAVFTPGPEAKAPTKKAPAEKKAPTAASKALPKGRKAGE